MKTILIIIGIIAVAITAVYFGFVPIKGIPRGKCSVKKVGFPDQDGFYYLGKCAT